MSFPGAGYDRGGERAAVTLTLIQTAKLISIPSLAGPHQRSQRLNQLLH
jgi:hypothetical protein